MIHLKYVWSNEDGWCTNLPERFRATTDLWPLGEGYRWAVTFVGGCGRALIDLAAGVDATVGEARLSCERLLDDIFGVALAFVEEGYDFCDRGSDLGAMQVDYSNVYPMYKISVRGPMHGAPLPVLGRRLPQHYNGAEISDAVRREMILWLAPLIASQGEGKVTR
jgi:hypothetical protein